MTVIWILAGLTAAVLLISYGCYRYAFYEPDRKEEPEERIDIPKGKIYEPFREKMENWIREARAMPHEDVQITSFDGLKLKGKFSSATEKYYFTEYDRTDEDEEEDWLDDAERIKMTGVRNISTLFDLYDLWLDDPETNLRQDKFDMILTLDEDGFITKIEAELE